MNKSALLFIPANDFNEEEYLVIKDALVRAGVRLFIASDSTNLCVGNNGLKVKADISLMNVHPRNFDAFIIVGGNGMRLYWKNQVLISIAQKFYELGKVIGAICSAPVLLAASGILKNHSATCYDKDKRELTNYGVDYKDLSVVTCGNIVTAQAPKDSSEFISALLHKIK